MCILQTEKVSLHNSRAKDICQRMEKDQLTCKSDVIPCLVHAIFKTIVVYATVEINGRHHELEVRFFPSSLRVCDTKQSLY